MRVNFPIPESPNRRRADRGESRITSSTFATSALRPQQVVPGCMVALVEIGVQDRLKVVDEMGFEPTACSLRTWNH